MGTSRPSVRARSWLGPSQLLAQVKCGVDDPSLVGHRCLHDAKCLGELLGGEVRRLRAIEQEVTWPTA
jgi:hypothetical protein